MAITKKPFGTTKDGEQVYVYILDNKKGVCAEILSYGGIVKNLYVNDKDGNPTDIVLGRNNMEEYSDNYGYLGALIGRNSNRIEDSEFVLNGKTYKLYANDGENNLHGGKIGFDKKVWDVIENETNGEPSIVLSLTSPDGEEGFPGTLDVTVTYTVTADNSLVINYKAKCDADTVCNMTNHSYFNLSGHDSGTVDNQTIKIASSFYTPNSSECMPTGEVLSVEGTPFDFRNGAVLGERFTADHEQIKLFKGFDHNFAIDGRGFRKGAEVSSPVTGIKMEMYTDQPAVQLYTANSLAEGVYKNGAKCGFHNALCLETQCFPNAMKHSHFPGAILKKGEVYDYTTEYKFSIK